MGDLRRLIVFDLDGTLIDSRTDLADAANLLIVERGGNRLSEEEIGRMVGDGAPVLVKRALTAAGLSIDDTSVSRFLELYDERLLATTKPYPGVVDALGRLKPLGSIAVLTNKPFRPTTRLLDELGLARFVNALIAGDGEFPRKPNPAGLIHLANRFEVDRKQTVMVGDSWIDYSTARNAGTSICLARYGFGFDSFPTSEIDEEEGLVDDPAELEIVIRRLLGA